jgi:hypothetical protein
MVARVEFVVGSSNTTIMHRPTKMRLASRATPKVKTKWTDNETMYTSIKQKSHQTNLMLVPEDGVAEHARSI